MSEALEKLASDFPFLENQDHHLNHLFADARRAVEDGDDQADDKVKRLEEEMRVETQTIAAAFKRFDKDHSDSLDKREVQLMNDYLGFPSSDDDVDMLFTEVDSDESGNICFDEFSTYVGHMGGTMRMYEVRRARIAEKGMSFDVGGDVDMQVVRMNLKLAGIEDDAQAYWRLVVPPTEFLEASRLVDPQQKALRHIRHLAKQNHENALPKVQKRVMKLGYSDTDLWMTLAWIRELAPVLIHLNLDKMLQWIESDTHYRNQFETGASGGLLNPGVRNRWEHDLFGGFYDEAQPFDRCKYGVLNVMNDHRGVIRCAQYGDSYLIMKDVRLRCTFSPEDSANLKADRLAVLDYYAHVLSEYTDDELTETLKVAQSSDAAILGDSAKVDGRGLKYKEAQYHGEVCFDKHVERLVANTRHRDNGDEDRIRAAAEKHGWGFSWMDEEQERMRKEEQHKLGGEAWKERLSKMQEGNDDPGEDVDEGFCKTGCGRPVAPGVTRNGNSYSTCCRGCVMGFGHDLRCGTIDPDKVGPGLCKNGCGNKLAGGTDHKGRPYTTCCRNCAMGLDTHSPGCGVDADDVPEGMCKSGCGRPVAPGTTRSGRTFDTCCRGCARGQDHSRGCIE